jgi:spore germination cell wall hydrolase CwlJ-like protein
MTQQTKNKLGFIFCMMILLFGLATELKGCVGNNVVSDIKPSRAILTAEQMQSIKECKYRVVEPVNEQKEKAVAMLAKLIYHEARNQPKEGQIMVCQVALNRCYWNLSKLQEALFFRNAFTGFERAYANINPSKEQRQTARESIEGKKLISADTKYYMNPKTATSRWMANRCLLIKRVKDHSFYELKGDK